MSTTYSFRAEASVDVWAFIVELDKRDKRGLTEVVATKNCVNEPLIELVVATLSFRDLQEIIATIPDGHVIAETLRPVPLADNSLRRRDCDTFHELCQPPGDTD